jgi:hypothetical protein
MRRDGNFFCNPHQILAIHSVPRDLLRKLQRLASRLNDTRYAALHTGLPKPPEGCVVREEVLQDLSEARTPAEHRRMLAGGGCRVQLVLSANGADPRRCATPSAIRERRGLAWHGTLAPIIRGARRVRSG